MVNATRTLCKNNVIRQTLPNEHVFIFKYKVNVVLYMGHNWLFLCLRGTVGREQQKFDFYRL